MMRLCAFCIIPIIINQSLPLVAQKKPASDSAMVTFSLGKRYHSNLHIDSALVIFDQFNLRGAGVIYKMVQPLENKIVLDKVPGGKYYIDIIFFGPKKQMVSKITYITPRKKNNIIRLRPESYEIYEPGSALLPKEHFDLEKLKITRANTFKP